MHGKTGFLLRYFNPRSPCGERHPVPLERRRVVNVFQSTLPVWGATKPWLVRSIRIGISIHAPRVGSDDDHGRYVMSAAISIHAPRVGSDSP